MKNTGTKKLKTQSLVLRKLRLTDYFDMKQWYTDPRVSRFSQGKAQNSKRDTVIFLLQRIWNYYFKRRRRYYFWAVEKKGKVIGFTGLNELKGKNAYSFYYMISPEFWGKGYTTEAVKAVTQYMKTQKADALYAACDSRNTASYGVIQKCGFEHFRTVQNAYRYSDGRTGDREIFKIILKADN